MDPLLTLTAELAKAQLRRANLVEAMARMSEKIAKTLRMMSEEDLKIVDLERQIRMASLTTTRKAAA